MELLEIAKANAAKALGTTNFDLPASLRSVAKETSSGAKMEVSALSMFLPPDLLTLLSVHCRQPSWDVFIMCPEKN